METLGERVIPFNAEGLMVTERARDLCSRMGLKLVLFT
jgi:hypothetical protein